MKFITITGITFLAVSGIFAATALSASATIFGPDDMQDGTAYGYWLMPEDGSPSNVTWPQSAVDPTTCGNGWIQRDLYRYASDADKATVDALWGDQKLTRNELNSPEDSSVYISHQFIQQIACATETETPSSPITPSMPATTTPTGVPTTPVVTTPPGTPSAPVSPVVTPTPILTQTSTSMPNPTPSSASTTSVSAKPGPPLSTPTASATAIGTLPNSTTGRSELAYTGSADLKPVMIGLAFLFFIGGSLILVARKRDSRSNMD